MVFTVIDRALDGGASRSAWTNAQYFIVVLDQNVLCSKKKKYNKLREDAQYVDMNVSSPFLTVRV
jgi:flagellar biosynthesis chaperone FliJ